jgi:hypothetical protein
MVRVSRLGKRGERVVTIVRRDAMDAVVTARRTWPGRTVKSCGPDTPTLVSSPRADEALGRRGQESPGPGEITYKRVPWKGTVLERVQVPPGKGRSGR